MESDSKRQNLESEYKYKLEDTNNVILTESCTKPFHMLVDKYDLNPIFKLHEIKEEHNHTNIVKELVPYTGKEYQYDVKEESYDKNEKNIPNTIEIYSHENFYKNETVEYKFGNRFQIGIEHLQGECNIKEPNIIVKELMSHKTINVKEVDHYIIKEEKYNKDEKNTYDTDKTVFNEEAFVVDTIKYKFGDTFKVTDKEKREEREIKDSNSIVKELVTLTDLKNVEKYRIKEERFGNNENNISGHRKIDLNKVLHTSEEVEYEFETIRVKSGNKHLEDQCGIRESYSIVKELVTHKNEKEVDRYIIKEDKYCKGENSTYGSEKNNLDKCLVIAADTMKYNIADTKFKNSVTEITEEYVLQDFKCTNSIVLANNSVAEIPEEYEVKDFKWKNSIFSANTFGKGNFRVNIEAPLVEKRSFSKNEIVNSSRNSRLGEFARLEESREDKEQNDKKLECAKCGKSFLQKNKLSDHMRKHRKFLFTCSHCHFYTPIKSTLTRHSVTHFDRSRRARKICLVCQSSFSNQFNLNRHMKIHSDEQERPFKCPNCKFTCTSGYVLKNHIATHTGDRPYQCSTCDFSTARRHSLIYHLQMHEGYQCKICSCKLVSSKQLKSHLEEVHNFVKTQSKNTENTKPFNYKCVICDKRYLHKCRLEVHMQTHSGQRPFTCANCQIGFATKSTLRSHISIVHLKIPLNCPYCEFISFSKLLFRKHVQVHGRNRFNCADCSFRTDLRHCIEKHVRVHRKKI